MSCSLKNFSTFRKLAKSNDFVEKFCLGYNLMEENPSQETIEKAYVRLDELGPEKYLAERWKAYNIQEEFISNELNTLNENWKNYSPTDVVFFREGNKIFVFTRPEFKDIINRKKNYYTGSILSELFISKIEILNNFAKAYNLPEGTYIEIFNKITQETTAPSRSNQQDPSNSSSTDVSDVIRQEFTGEGRILYDLFSSMMRNV